MVVLQKLAIRHKLAIEYFHFSICSALVIGNRVDYITTRGDNTNFTLKICK